MAVNLLTFENYIAPGIGVTNIDNNTININFTAVSSAISTNAVYSTPNGNITAFRSLVAGSYSSIVETATTITVNVSGSGVSSATSLGSDAIYTGTSNNTLQFRGVSSGGYINIVPTTTTLLISCDLSATSLGSNAIYTGTSNNTLQFRGITAGSFINASTSSTSILISRPDISFGGIYWTIFNGNSPNVTFTPTPQELTPAFLGGTNYQLLTSSTADWSIDATTKRLKYSGSITNRPFYISAVFGTTVNVGFGFIAQIYVNSTPVGFAPWLVAFTLPIYAYVQLNSGDTISVRVNRPTDSQTVNVTSIIINAFSLA